MTPEAAVDRAFWSVKLPSLSAMVGPWLVFAALGELGVVPSVGYSGLRWFLPVFIGGFVAGWLVWAIQVPRWRRWAYAQVADVDDLKRHAVATQLIWPEGHFFERTEIVPGRLREELRALEQASRKRCANARQSAADSQSEGQ